MLHMSRATIDFAFNQGKFPLPCDPNNLIMSMTRLFDCYISDYKKEGAKLPSEIEEICLNAIMFAYIWAVGGALDETSRP